MAERKHESLSTFDIKEAYQFANYLSLTDGVENVRVSRTYGTRYAFKISFTMETHRGAHLLIKELANVFTPSINFHGTDWDFDAN